MWQILYASFWKFSRLSNSGISLNWSITDEVTTRNTTAYFFWPTLYSLMSHSTCNRETSLSMELTSLVLTNKLVKNTKN